MDAGTCFQTMTQATKNRVLRSLDPETRAAVEASCDIVDLEGGAILEKDGERTRAAYFPESGVISTLASYSDGSVVEMANIGREAATGENLALGRPTQLNTLEVQIPGMARRLPAERYLKLRNSHPDFERAVFSTLQAVLHQVMVSGACNAAHDTQQRLSRWLLTMHDRSDGDRMRLTHEFLAHMLGVRRATVTKAAAELQEKGLISYRYGRVTIEDKAGLRRASCECYDLVRNAQDALLPETPDGA